MCVCVCTCRYVLCYEARTYAPVTGARLSSDSTAARFLSLPGVKVGATWVGSVWKIREARGDSVPDSRRFGACFSPIADASPTVLVGHVILRHTHTHAHVRTHPHTHTPAQLLQRCRRVCPRQARRPPSASSPKPPPDRRCPAHAHTRTHTHTHTHNGDTRTR
jgi:hypothetical protein